jgi:DNA repair exonuclease SbcCD nuclease subunit
MVRIAHLADTHLGLKQYNLNERERDIYDSLDEISEKILEERVDIIIHSGDLFDSPRPTPGAYLAFKKFLGKLDGRAKFFAVLGDHDKSKSGGLAPQVLFEDQVKVLGVNGCVEHHSIIVDGKDVVIAGLSNLSRAYHTILTEELNKLSSLQLEGKLSILVLHEGIDKFLPYEGAYELSLDELPRNFDYIAMGHVHARIKASHGKGELTYPGSSEIIRKDEIGGWQKLGKGFYVVDFNSGNVDVKDINLDCIRPQREMKLNYAYIEKDLTEALKQLECQGKLPIVHVRVEGKNIDRQGVHKALNNALAGKTLIFRPEVVEETDLRIQDLKSGSFNINQVIRDYFKDEIVSGFAVEMFKLLSDGDVTEAQKVADEYYKRARKT